MTGIKPFFHFDTPQVLADEYGSLLSVKIVFVNPITFGEYPKNMQSIVGRRLPNSTEAQSKMLKGSLDFPGVNYCTTNYADNDLSFNGFNLSYTADRQANLTSMLNILID
ncbi:hypothetical protein Patl1_19641 [Pistacia atlantica]|uniref:Uncharacterized protein n=1 Tax=Pistacia atlantica TaxID=434234 RepID=A0ACC1BXP8_9ROSI|nr:hypothetical protein Patl1_19641 [Pistacia atlantica]